MKKIIYYLIAFFFVAFSWQGMAQYYTEDFENGGTFPSDWTLTNGTNDWAIDQGDDYGPGTAYSGTYSAFFNDYDYSSGVTADMITPNIDLSGATDPVLTFWYYDSGGSDTVEILVSTDGTSYTSIGTTPDTNNPWSEISIDLIDYIGQATVTIAWRGTSVYGYNNPHVDNITVAERPEYAPVTTLADLRAGTIGEKYEFTGTGYATAARLSASGNNSIRVFGQDDTAGMQFYAAAGVISAPTINFGDGVTGVKGVLTEAYGNLVFVVEHDITFDGNQPVTPQVVTAQDYIDNREDYESELIQILNTTIDPNGDTTFGESNTNYAITDPTGALTLGVIFPQLNGNIPAHANVTGIAVEYFGNAFILPRGDVDVEEIPCPDVMNISADNFTGTSADLSWDAATGATDYNWEIQPQGTAQGDAAMIESGSVSTESATATLLVSGTAYTLYVQSDCGNGALGTWMSYDFTLPIPGETCDAPIVIDATALPYTTSDDTANYGDDYENGDSTCSSYYLSGDDVVYSFTPTADGSFNIIMSNIGATYSAIHVMDACLTGAETCVGFVGNSSTDDRELNNLALEGGTEYFIVISTWATPQSTTYDLEITENTASVDDLMSVGFNFYPNPIEDTLTMTANENITSISIFNMLGQEVIKEKLSTLEANINMSRLSNGTYFVKVQVGQTIGTFKVIKK